jgi:hypothetical protein
MRSPRREPGLELCDTISDNAINSGPVYAANVVDRAGPAEKILALGCTGTVSPGTHSFE